MNWPNLSQESLKLVELWARPVMQYYTANAIGRTEVNFPKTASLGQGINVHCTQIFVPWTASIYQKFFC